MNANDVRLRLATADDAGEIRSIYAPYVENTAITFEYDVPSVEEFRHRITGTLAKYPYIVAEIDKKIVGYAYTGAFHPRAAYFWTAETSIYINRDCRKMGLGKRLYRAIEQISRAQNLLNLNACVATTDAPDEHLDNNSLSFHAHLGYRTVGEFTKCGYKFGKWYNMTWMEKALGEHTGHPAPVIPFPELDRKVLVAAGVSGV